MKKEDQLKKPTKEAQEAQRRYLELQRKEMLGEVNRYYAAKHLGRPPSDTEAILYYIENGGAEKFNQRFSHIICPLPEKSK